MFVVVVGASFAEPGSPLVAGLEAELGADVEVVGVGVRGAPLTRWLPRTLAEHGRTLAEADAVVVVELGGNGVPDPADVDDAHRELRAFGAPVVWLDPPRWPSSSPAAPRRAQTAAALARAGVPVARSGWAPAETQLAGDRAHLTPGGYRAMARAFAGPIRSQLRGGPPPWVPPAAALLVAVLALAVFR